MNYKAKHALPAIILAALLLAGCSNDAAEPAAATPTPELLSADYGAGQIVISEFMEKNRATVQDEDGDFPDWIELFNQGSQTVTMQGWTISDKENKSGWLIPDTTLAPGERIVIFASGKDKSSGELHADFSLSGDEGIYLRNSNGELIADALCGDCKADISLVLQDDGSYAESLYATPGYDNTSAGYIAFQQEKSCESPLVINEVMVYNDSIPTDAGEYFDWVELKNVSSQTINLSEYYLSDDDDDYLQCPLPDIELEAGAVAVIYCTEEAPLLKSTKTVGFELDSENEQLFLTGADGKPVDYVSLKDIPYGASMGRMDGENGWFYFISPSIGSDNIGGLRYVAEAPTSLTADGVFDGIDGMYVELSASGTIHYTLDGSEPNWASTPYTEPIYIDSTTVIRAVNIEAGAVPSPALSLSFIINEGHSLPVLSLLTDDPDSFNIMYNAGQKGKELSGSLSLYDEDGSFTIPCGVSMNGETSLSMSKKNMSVRFRAAYGQSTLDYDIYGGGVTEFTNLLLRSGQDYNEAIIRNELCQELAFDASDNIINQRSKYCVLYVNGSYSGIYTLKEKANEQLYAGVADVSRSSVTVLEAPVAVDTDFYKDIVELCMYNDMSLDENYQKLCQALDIDSLIDWMILENYFANTDVASGNLRYCRSTENDGKWRLMLYDLDATFKDPSSVYLNLMTQYAQENRQISAFTVPLMQNAEFRQRFLTRASELFGSTLTVENVMAKIDELCAVIAPEVERDYARYNRTLDDWQYGVDELKYVITANDWQQLNIDNLCSVFGLSQEEREQYFG